MKRTVPEAQEVILFREALEFRPADRIFAIKDFAPRFLWCRVHGRNPARFNVISMEFLSLSRRRSTFRKVPSGGERGGNPVFADYSFHSFGLIFEKNKKMGCLLKTNKSAVLVAKVQDMTDRYDIANLQKHIFFSNWKNFLSSLYFIFFSYHSFRNVYRFFFVLYRVLPTHSVQKEEKKWRIWVSIPVLPACKAGALPFELIPPTMNTRMKYKLKWYFSYTKL